jgi:xylitol oxidase
VRRGHACKAAIGAPSIDLARDATRECNRVHETNWAGNHTYPAHTIHHPRTVAKVRDIVVAAPHVRVLGTRHSFSDIADADELIVLDGLPTHVEVDHDASTASVPAGMTYGRLGVALRDHGVALANLASLPHVCVAGAVATATHGSSDATGNLATAVAGMQLVTSSGDVLDVTRHDPDFDGMVVGLGALGVVTRLTLDVERAYEIVQRTYTAMPFDALLDGLDEVMAAGYSVSVLTNWGPTVDRVWVKHRTDAGTDPGADVFHGASPVSDGPDGPRDIDLTVPGAWSDRLPHFSMDQTPSVGEELQAEYFVARHLGAAALRAVRELVDVVQPVLHISEIRTVAADRLWLSPQYGQDTLAIAFTLRLDPDGVAAALVDVEAALAPFGARPHWGKLFHHDATAIAALYERHDDFVRLVDRMDERGAFRNAWLRTRVLGDV